MRRCRRSLFGARHNIQQHAIVCVQMLRHNITNLLGRYVEIGLQFGIEQLRLVVIKRGLCDLLSAKQR